MFDCTSLPWKMLKTSYFPICGVVWLYNLHGANFHVTNLFTLSHVIQMPPSPKFWLYMENSSIKVGPYQILSVCVYIYILHLRNIADFDLPPIHNSCEDLSGHWSSKLWCHQCSHWTTDRWTKKTLTHFTKNSGY